MRRRIIRRRADGLDLRTLPEKRRAKPEPRRPLLDGDLVVAAHALQMPDQVPARPRDGCRLLPRGLLHLVLADDREARVPRLLHDLRAVRLRHGDDLDLSGIASRPRTRGGDLAAHFRQNFVQVTHRTSLSFRVMGPTPRFRSGAYYTTTTRRQNVCTRPPF